MSLAGAFGKGVECCLSSSSFIWLKGKSVSEELWNRCLSRLEEELPSQQFNMWIRPLQAVAGADGSELVLFAPNRFVVDWVKDQYRERIAGLLQELNPEASPAIRIEVGSSRSPCPDTRTRLRPGPRATGASALSFQPGGGVYL